MNDRQIAQLIEQGLTAHRAGNLQQAEAAYRQVLSHRPGHPDGLHLLGVIAHQVGQHQQAIQLIHAALQAAPRLQAAWNNLGEALRANGQIDDAIKAYQNAIAIQPTFSDAIGNLARTYDSLQRFKESIDLWQRFIRLNPRHVEAYHALATALHATGQEPQAIACWEKLLSLDPNFYKAHNDIGVVLGGRYLFDRAEKHFFESIRIEPKYAVAYYNLGVIYERQARYQDAINQYRQSIALDPTAPDPQLNLALMLLVTGDLPNGLAQYEWRWKLPRVIPLIKHFAQPEWRGEDITGKTLLIHAEQGMGDTIQFCRYAKDVLAKGAAKVYLMAQPPLVSLLQQVEGVAGVYPDVPDVQLPPFDVQIPSMSLPLVMKTRLETIPADVPYLKADPAKAAYWREQLAGDRNFRVGFVWAGRPEHHNDHNRSATLELFGLLARVPGVTFYSLQKGPAVAALQRPPAGMTIVDCSPALHDFSDTAALLENLDLLISVDTSVVHLAGAMGKEVWTLLPLVPDWRWLLDREDTPWYPTMRLFRQTRIKDWPPVFARVADELAKKVTTRETATV